MEACSEHPLAGAVLDWAAARLGVQAATLGGELSAGTAPPVGGATSATEQAALPGKSPVSSPRSHTPRRRALRNTEWVRPASDVAIEQGEHHLPSMQGVTSRGVTRQAARRELARRPQQDPEAASCGWHSGTKSS